MHVALPRKDRVGRELHSVLSRFLVWIDNAASIAPMSKLLSIAASPLLLDGAAWNAQLVREKKDMLFEHVHIKSCRYFFTAPTLKRSWQGWIYTAKCNHSCVSVLGFLNTFTLTLLQLQKYLDNNLVVRRRTFVLEWAFIRLSVIYLQERQRHGMVYHG